MGGLVIINIGRSEYSRLAGPIYAGRSVYYLGIQKDPPPLFLTGLFNPDGGRILSQDQQYYRWISNLYQPGPRFQDDPALLRRGWFQLPLCFWSFIDPAFFWERIDFLLPGPAVSWMGLEIHFRSG